MDGEEPESGHIPVAVRVGGCRVGVESDQGWSEAAFPLDSVGPDGVGNVSRELKKGGVREVLVCCQISRIYA